MFNDKLIENMKKMQKLSITCERIGDLSRAMSDCAIGLESKADINDIERIEEKLHQEYTPIRQFMTLKQVTSNKAEWTDLNDTIVKLHKVTETVGQHQK